MTSLSSSSPLIFTHYGNSPYLRFTLMQASKTNPSIPKILIGDHSNVRVAQSAGWKHVSMSELFSEKRDQFNARFFWVQGKNHNPVKGGRDWLRYVSDRFFAIEELVVRLNTPYFWHFDSDTMIMNSLREYEHTILGLGLDCTTLCNDSCPSGVISQSLLKRYTESMISDYKDRDFLSDQQSEFDTINTGYAFTEMRAFARFRQSQSINCQHLSSLFVNMQTWFDDCICQSDIFKTFRVQSIDRSLKYLYQDGRKVCGITVQGESFEFATVNCSWVPLDVFEWLSVASAGRDDLAGTLHDHMRIPIKKRILGKIKTLWNAKNRFA